MCLSEYSILDEHEDTLKNLSYDSSNDAYITESCKLAHNFDLIVRDYYTKIGRGGSIPKSNDVIWWNSNGFMFIEFKNGNLNKSKIKNIISKNKKSIRALKDISNGEVDNDCVKSLGSYLLVYNIDNINYEIYKTQAREYLHETEINASNAKAYLYSKLARKARIERPVLFGLNCLKEKCKVVVTIEKEEFNNIVEDLEPDCDFGTF